MNSHDVVRVTALAARRISVHFADGLSGQVEFRDTHLFGVFEALKDPEFFSQVHCKQGFVEWPGDIDLAPDAMYEEITARGVWVLE